MIRTIEVLFVIIILSGAFIAVSYFTVLPSPREISPINLRRLSFTTLQMLDSDYDLSTAAFESGNATQDAANWNGLQVALAASLPANVIYNLTVYNVSAADGQIYSAVKSFSNVDIIGAVNDVSTYTVASANVTFHFTPEKIGEHNGGTLYILNCSDANGWGITGYTAQGLAQDLYTLLSPYFVNTIMVQNTTQLGTLLDGHTISNSSTERVQNAVVINTFGEAVPIPNSYVTQYYTDYGQYCNLLGKKVNQYNWTWASIVGYPFYYVSNTNVTVSHSISGQQNGYGVYGMKQVGQLGINAFLQGLDGQRYNNADTTKIANDIGVVTLSQDVINYCNYYGIFPSTSQTSARALNNTIRSNYNLTVATQIFDEKSNCFPGAVFQHIFRGQTNVTGSFLAVGLTSTPDIRVTAVGLLSYYQPRVYASEYTATDTSRLVVLQLGLAGGS
jgi:hypothetical protein